MVKGQILATLVFRCRYPAVVRQALGTVQITDQSRAGTLPNPVAEAEMGPI